MVDIQSDNEARPDTQVSPQPVHDSDFKIYFEQNPEMAHQLLKVLLHLYQDPAKESQAAA